MLHAWKTEQSRGVRVGRLGIGLIGPGKMKPNAGWCQCVNIKGLWQVRLFRFAVAWAKTALKPCRCGQPIGVRTQTLCVNCSLIELGGEL